MPLDPKILDYYRSNRERHLDGLKELLRIPSVGAMKAHADDTMQAARYVAKDLESIGLQGVRLIEGDGFPLVYGEWLDAPGKPTLLVYGHYDVQPPDPLDEWVSPPFEPTVRGDNLYARGAVDDKGQMWLILKALEGHLQAIGKLPVNVKVLIEGEEESSGQVLEHYLQNNGDSIGADAALICDTEMFAPGLPTIALGVRGMVYAEIEVQGARIDLHSGSYGGAAPNALMAMAEVLTGLKDREGRVQIPGFYDDVQPIPEELLAVWRSLPFDEGQMLANEVGSTELTGEPNYSTLERLWARPTFEVHGIRGGFVGDGAKTVIPAKAVAKVSMRLVPDMDPEKVAAGLVERVKALQPKGCLVNTRIMAKAPAAVTPMDHPFTAKAKAALDATFENETVFTRCGGSIPVVGLLQEAGIPSVMIGFGLPDDNLHAPNEKFHLPNFYQGIEAIGRYLAELGDAQ